MTGTWAVDYARTWPTTTGHGPILGVNLHTGAPSWYYTEATAAGLGTVRLNLIWSVTQTTSGGAYTWTDADAKMTAAVQAGFTTVLWNATGWPSWVTDTGSPSSGTTTQYAAFVAAAAARYAAGGAFWTANPSLTNTVTTLAIELWNEPYFDSAGLVTTAAHYAPFAAAAAAAIKAGTPSVKVLLSAVTWDTGSTTQTWIANCNAAAAGLLANCDALSLHPYANKAIPWGPIGWNQSVQQTPSQNIQEPTIAYLTSPNVVIPSQEAARLGHPLPVWITEYGDTTVPSGSGRRRPIALRDGANACATTNITLSGTQTVDGVALVAGNTCLVTGQTTASQNGFYTVASGAWTRASWLVTGAQARGAYVTITGGTANKGTWVQSADGVVGTVAQVWGKMDAAQVTEDQAAARMRQVLQMCFSRWATFPWGPGVQRFIAYDYSIASGTTADDQGNFSLLRAGSTSGSPDYKPAWDEILKFV